MTSKKESTIQLEQKLIHYRAEIVNFEQKIDKLEKELMKEKIRNQYLQKKRYEAEHVNIHIYEKEMNRLKDQLLALEVAVEEEKERNHALVMSSSTEVQPETREPRLQAFFNYATLLSDYSPKQKKVIIISDLSIQNIGTEYLHNLIICIKLSPNHAGQLNGKILTPSSKFGNQSPFNPMRVEEWEFVHENFRERISESGEYWIKPTKIQELKPTEQVSFSNFELILTPPSDKHSVIVNGFAYCKEISAGIKAQNNIVVNF